MSQTAYLDIDHIAESQNQKEVTANAAFDRLSGALAGISTQDLAGLSGNVTVTEAVALETLVLYCTGALAAAVNLIIPAKAKLYVLIHSGTGFDVTLKTASGAGVTLSPTEAQFLYCNGTNVLGIDAAGSFGGQATEKTRVLLDGAGDLTTVAIGANITVNTDALYVHGVRMRRGSDYSVTESVPASGNYDTLTPLINDIFPVGTDNLELEYY